VKLMKTLADSAHAYIALFAVEAVIVETLFGWPGIGQLAAQSISNDDLPVVQAVVFVAASLVVVLNIVIDLCYAALDPRIRYR
jgi:ABC-type dipeptide/oligopeptide/nickel transport system permease component